MVFNSLDDITRKKVALKAQLKAQEKHMTALKTALVSPIKDSSGKGKRSISSVVNAKNVIAALDGVWFVWKLYKKFKK